MKEKDTTYFVHEFVVSDDTLCENCAGVVATDQLYLAVERAVRSRVGTSYVQHQLRGSTAAISRKIHTSYLT